jgi:hypothetical protein
MWHIKVSRGQYKVFQSLGFQCCSHFHLILVKKYKCRINGVAFEILGQTPKDANITFYEFEYVDDILTYIFSIKDVLLKR